MGIDTENLDPEDPPARARVAGGITIVISDGYIDRLKIARSEAFHFDILTITGGYTSQAWETRPRVFKRREPPVEQLGVAALHGARILRLTFHGLHLQGGAHWAGLVREALADQLASERRPNTKVTEIHLAAGRNDFLDPLPNPGGCDPETTLERTIRGGVSFIEELIESFPLARFHYWGPGRLYPAMSPWEEKLLGPMTQLLEGIKRELRPSFPRGRQSRGRRILIRDMFDFDEGDIPRTERDGTLTREGIASVGRSVLFESFL